MRIAKRVEFGMMNPNSRLQAYLQEKVGSGCFPGATYLVAAGGKPRWLGAVGHAVVIPEPIAAYPNTLYDLASLTKPLVTGLLMARLFEAGRLQPQDPLPHHLPWFNHLQGQSIKLVHLLTHSAGLPAWRPLYLVLPGPEACPAYLSGLPLEALPGSRVIYSDLGFILLGYLIAQTWGQPIGRVFTEQVATPLGLQQTCFNPPASWRRWIAASEIGNRREQEMVDDLCPGRRVPSPGLLWGAVHDGNARFMGGVSGHAGLFATVQDVFWLAEQFTLRSKLLSQDWVNRIRANWTEGMEQARGLSWQLAATSQSSAGRALSSHAFGHSGFTGTSLWIDPVRDQTFILLTNRTHPKDQGQDLNPVRQGFHKLAQAELEAH